MPDPFTPRDKQRIRARAEAMNAEFETTGRVAVTPAGFEDLDAPYRVSVAPLEHVPRFSGKHIGTIGQMAVIAWRKDGRG
jgi:hypothetical protein